MPEPQAYGAPGRLLLAQLSDPAIETMLGDQAMVQAMVEVEATLARVQGRLGVVPAEAAVAIDNALKGLRLDPATLRPGMLASGVPTIALVAALRARLPQEVAGYLHWGATSQDIVDTALVLRLRPVLDLLDDRLRHLGDRLDARMIEERQTPMLARTRFQQAVPTTLGLRLAGWLMPLLRHRQRLAELRPRLLLLQLGGAAGNLSALGGQGMAVAQALATELCLTLPAVPWHAQRDGIVELGAFAANLSGSLGKLGLDVLLAAQSEVGEMREAEGGGSSTMPQKSNPVRAEALVAIARRQSGLLAALQPALLHAQERDGSAWALEWASLPELLSGTAAALDHAQRLVETLAFDRRRMAAAIGAGGGLALAEAVSFALAARMPRVEAQALVKACVEQVQADGGTLLERVVQAAPVTIDVAELSKAALDLPAAGAMIDAAHGAWKAARSDKEEQRP